MGEPEETPPYIKGFSAVSSIGRRFPRRPSAELKRRHRVTWPQQIEADIIRTVMVRLERIFRQKNLRERIVTMIHDALWLQASQGEETAVRDPMQTEATGAGDLDVPLIVDFE